MKTARPFISTERLVMTLLDVDDAIEMVDVLADPDLYEFTGGEPPSLEELRVRYEAQTKGSPRPDEQWLNWIIRTTESNTAVGYIQATIIDGDAEMAWVVGAPWQGAGIASEASRAIAERLSADGATSLSAHIHPDHPASQRVAEAIGLRQTDEIDDEGEVVWRSFS